MKNNKCIWDEKLALQQLFYYNQSCSRFATHLDDKPRILTYSQISPNIFFADKLSYENKSKSSKE